CGVCYTNNIRINGMEGPYTAVLIDGMPLMSSLASVYGLNGINPALIEQIEIVKGPASTLYGSEAMAGVVNVITKDPRFAPRLSVDAHATSDAEGNVDFAAASEPGGTSGFVSGNVAYNQRFVDENGDGFSDFPLTRRGVLFAKMDRSSEGVRRGGLSARYLFEDRFGGVRGWTTGDRGSDEVYGESVVTNRAELIGSWLPSWSDAVRLEGSYTWHDQSSFYGDTEYDASQHIGFANLLWGERLGRHDLLVGTTARYQRYDDNTPATAVPDTRIVPGLLVQDEARWAGGSSVLMGLRADRYGEHGVVFSPRLALKWEPLEHTALRVNAGTGFRAVNLFTEDHAALSGARDVVIMSELQPERSRSVTLNLNQVVEFGPNPMMIDFDAFHTRFSNKIVPDYDQDPGLIVYDNLSGHAVSRGVALSLNQNVDFDRFLYSVGVTLQDVYTDRDGVREQEFFAPRVRGVASATYNFRGLPVMVDYTGSLTGPMRLPAYDAPFSRPERSPSYAVHNLQGTWRWSGGAEVYLSVKNVLDYVQPSPLVNPAEPFSDSFDTAYVYGPLRGRHLMLGFRYGVPR
ncbi:MAG: TonB-dependent receptor, partial [Gemmatimonadota bacterium]